MRFTIAAVHRLVLSASLCAVCAVAHADATRDALAEIGRCSAIAEPAERLRCFDRAAPRAREALVPKAEDFGKPPPPRPPEVDQVVATVRELSKTVRGQALFVLDNGQTWRQLEGDDARVLEPPAGTPLKVTIARGALGSYNLTIEGRTGLIRVRRIE